VVEFLPRGAAERPCFYDQEYGICFLEEPPRLGKEFGAAAEWNSGKQQFQA
jgi:hypothetical protein